MNKDWYAWEKALNDSLKDVLSPQEPIRFCRRLLLQVKIEASAETHSRSGIDAEQITEFPSHLRGQFLNGWLKPLSFSRGKEQRDTPSLARRG